MPRMGIRHTIPLLLPQTGKKRYFLSGAVMLLRYFILEWRYGAQVLEICHPYSIKPKGILLRYGSVQYRSVPGFDGG